MSIDEMHKNVALAIDGGGIKGLIAVRALADLEKALNVEALIEYDNLKVLAGTSTGAIITAALAVGMSAQEITRMYITAGQTVFPPLLPAWVPASLAGLYKLALGLFKPAVYKNDTLRNLLRENFAAKTGNPDYTLGDLGKQLGDGRSLIITAADITARRTRFLKSYDEKDASWKLWEAVMASAAAPTLLPVIQRETDGKIRYYTDGGVGSYANPGYIAAHEAVEWLKYAPADVTVLSLGTGWTDEETFMRAVGPPNKWRNIDWAMNAILIMLGDAARAQSIDIIHDYVTQKMDFRRFQVWLDPDIGMDDTSDDAISKMQRLGADLGKRIVANQHALGKEDGFDPEGLRAALKRYVDSVRDKTGHAPVPENIVTI